MTTYLIKMILCSGILLFAYFLLFEKEKMHRFNRFYLLFSIAFSFLVPFISIKNQKEVLPFAETVYVVTENIDYSSGYSYTDNTSPVAVPTKSEDWRPGPLLIVYIMIAAGLFFRFAKNLFLLLKKSWIGEKLRYQNAKLVLCNNLLVPFSFLNSIFIVKDEYENGKVEKEILQHELAHVKQKHSLDILVTELLLCFAWFNPFLYGYKKAIQLNHEFLADDDVLKTFRNTASYQHLLLNKISSASHSLLTSSFNYITTKKRLIMMMKTSSTVAVVVKQFVLLPLLAVLIFLFSTKLAAQVNQPIKISSGEKEQVTKDSVKHWLLKMSIGYTKEGASEELMKEYRDLVDKYKRSDSINVQDFQKISKEDQSRMEVIFRQMSKEQQNEQLVLFLKGTWPLSKIVPTKEQIERFKNPDMYGVWIDEKKVSNQVLNKYKNTDFSRLWVSNLYGAAKKGKRYSFQVDLLTNEYYKEYNDKANGETKNSRMVVFSKQGKQLAMFGTK
jgi:bla regulator protein blaR1